jgi:two-component system, cell cycle response regulator DivK
LVERRTSPDRRRAHRGGRREADHSGRAVILVVDDHADSRELVAAVLLDVGVAVAEAATGGEAPLRARSKPRPHLILIDLSLPDCHGTDVVRTLKQDEATKDIPVVALSASVMAADKERAAEAGCAEFIEKPVIPDAMIGVIRRVLGAAGTL